MKEKSWGEEETNEENVCEKKLIRGEKEGEGKKRKGSLCIFIFYLRNKSRSRAQKKGKKKALNSFSENSMIVTKTTKKHNQLRKAEGEKEGERRGGKDKWTEWVEKLMREMKRENGRKGRPGEGEEKMKKRMFE